MSSFGNGVMLCQVCDGPAVPEAPLPLCADCIAKIARYVREIGQPRPTFAPVTDATCPYCHLGALIRNVDTEEISCTPRAGGCGRVLPIGAEYPRQPKRRPDAGNAPRQRAAGAVVYYLRMGDQIKIGTSLDPDGRARSLSLTPQHIVATEPGGAIIERRRHAQFAHLHAHGEWFRAEEPLLSYIATLG